MSGTTHTHLIGMLCDPASAEEGLRRLAGQYGERIYWHIRRLVVRHEDAQELTQDTLLLAFQHIGSFRGKGSTADGEGSFTGWLLRIAANEALQFLRSRKHRQGRESGDVELLKNLPADEIDVSDEAAMLFAQAMLTLPPRQRTVFSIRYYEELPFGEIARIVGISVSNAKTTYHYAEKKIKEYLKNNGYV